MHTVRTSWCWAFSPSFFSFFVVVATAALAGGARGQVAWWRGLAWVEIAKQWDGMWDVVDGCAVGDGTSGRVRPCGSFGCGVRVGAEGSFLEHHPS